MVWKLVAQLAPIKDMNVRAATFASLLDESGRAELERALQRTNDRRLILALKLALGRITAPVLSDFGVWLVLQGRVAFERALADPDTLADFDELGRVDVVGRFAFEGPTRGDRWDKTTARRRLQRMIAKYGTSGPKTPEPAEPAELAPVVLLGFLATLLRDPAVVELGKCMRLEPRVIGDIELVTVSEGEAFDRPPPVPEAHLLWVSMRKLAVGEVLEIEGVGTLSKSERPGFTAYDPDLGREREVTGQVVYKLRLHG